MIYDCFSKISRNNNAKPILYVLLFAPPLLMLICLLIFTTVNVPYLEDTRVILGHLIDHTNSGLLRFLDFNNEHCLLTTRIAANLIYAVVGDINFKTLCAFGAMFLVGWTSLLIFKFLKYSPGMLLGAALAYMSFSFIHFENLCWAVGSLSNYQSLFWPLCANMLLMRHERPLFFAGTIFAGLLASGSTNCGLAIWPSLIMQLIHLHFIKSNNASKYFYIRLTILSLFSIITISIYLAASPVSSISHKAPFSLCRLFEIASGGIAFLGAYIPFVFLAKLIGVITLFFIIAIIIHWRRIKSIDIFFHLIYLLGIAAGASIRRTDELTSFFTSRYAIFPIGIAFCTLWLFIETYAQNANKKVMQKISSIVLLLAVLFSTATLCIGVPQYRKRNEIMRKNILLWPESLIGIRCWDHEREEYNAIFNECLKRGIYNPLSNLKKGENRPKHLTPWLK